jgi:hypothetical protein
LPFAGETIFAAFTGTFGTGFADGGTCGFDAAAAAAGAAGT